MPCLAGGMRWPGSTWQSTRWRLQVRNQGESDHNLHAGRKQLFALFHEQECPCQGRSCWHGVCSPLQPWRWALGKHHCWCHTAGHGIFSRHQSAPGAQTFCGTHEAPSHPSTHPAVGQQPGQREPAARPRHLLSLHDQRFPLTQLSVLQRASLTRASPALWRGGGLGPGPPVWGASTGRPMSPHHPPAGSFQPSPQRSSRSIFAQRAAQRVSSSRDARAKKAYFKLVGKRTLFGGN